MNSYIDLLRRYNCKCINDIIDMCRSELPSDYKLKPWTYPELNHGANILQNDDALNCYMASYGEMHEDKCRVALQNFPFDIINASIEIIDWGCGQGIGSITVLEALCNHNLESLLKRITLIEPSVNALKRAEENINHLTGKSVELNILNKYLPCIGSHEDVIDYVACRYKFVIHVFSNILDVKEIDIVKIAELISKSEGTHIIIVTGPKNSASYRIEQFCSLFGSDKLFSNVNSSNYDVTSTGHIYTCVSKGFVYEGGPLDYDKMRSIQPVETPVYDDYNLKLYLQNNVFDKNMGRVAFRLWNVLNDKDLIYYDCKINEAYVNFVILRKDCGILLVNVFCDNISDYQFKEIPADKDRNTLNYNYNVLVKDNDIEIQSPISQIKVCHTSIRDGVEEILFNTIENVRDFGIIRKTVIFANNTQKEVDEFFSCVDVQFIKLYGNEFIYDSNVSKHLYKDNYFYKKYDFFNDDVFKKVKRIISPGWHSYREGQIGIKLTTIQDNLAKSRNIEQKISGVAGCGKTQVLVTRAVNAQKRTGGDVLILTFNITLANYLRYRMEQLREDFNWNKFLIMHYHHFFRLIASKFHLKVDMESYDEVYFFEKVKDELPKFSAVFIDEVQDYDTSWLQILKQYFLEEGGEFVVFGDPKQNVYHRELDKQGNIRIGVIGGEWNNSMKKSKRFTNPLIADLAVRFQQNFFDRQTEGLSITDNDRQSEASFNFNVVSYYDMMNDCSSDSVVKKCISIMDNSRMGHDNFVILSSNSYFLRRLDYAYRKLTNKDTQTSFISKEKYDKLMRIHRVESINDKADWKFAMDLEALDRSKKYRFSTGAKCLKLSTIQSFKGWESPSVILILDQETKPKPEDNNDKKKPKNGKDEPPFEPDSPEVIYTALTRAREQLYVINLKCAKYNDFFKNI